MLDLVGTELKSYFWKYAILPFEKPRHNPVNDVRPAERCLDTLLGLAVSACARRPNQYRFAFERIPTAPCDRGSHQRAIDRVGRIGGEPAATPDSRGGQTNRACLAQPRASCVNEAGLEIGRRPTFLESR